MKGLSNQAKEEILHALEGNQTGVFFVNGKLVFIEVEDFNDNDKLSFDVDIEQEIEQYTELKESLQRYLDHPEMKRYSASKLKEIRHARRG